MFDGRLLVDGRKLTGYFWAEEVLAGVAKDAPYNIEPRMKDRGALYETSLLPFASNVVGRLITGQNPASAKVVVDMVVGALANTSTNG